MSASHQPKPGQTPMQKEREFIRKQLEKLFVKTAVKEAESVLYQQSVECANLKGGEVLSTYKKLCYERIGELLEVAPEERMTYLKEEVQDPSLVWSSPLYRQFQQKESERREVLVSHSMGMTVQKGEMKCKDPSCGCTNAAIWLEQTRSSDEPMTTFYQCLECGRVTKE